MFGGNPASGIDVDDWIREMQQTLDADELPAALGFATVLHHLEGRAKMLVLELPLRDQSPAGAFGKLRAEYATSRRSLDPAIGFLQSFEQTNEFKATYSVAAVLRSFKAKAGRRSTSAHKDLKVKPQVSAHEKNIHQKPPDRNPKLVMFREQGTRLCKDEFGKPQEGCDPAPSVQVGEKCLGDASELAGAGSSFEQDPALLELTTLVKQLALHQKDQMERLQRMEKFQDSASPEAKPTADKTSGSDKGEAKLKTNLDSKTTRSQNCERSCTCYVCGQEGHKVKGSKSRKQPYRASKSAALFPGFKHVDK